MKSRRSESEPGSISHLWQQSRKGDQQACSDLYVRLLPRMYAKAQTSIGPISQRGVEVEDVVQSAIICFWEYSEAGKLTANLNRDDLWSLVSTFTINKTKQHIRRENAQKRGGGTVIGENQLHGEEQRLEEMLYQTPTYEFDLAIEELLAPLDEESTRIALLKMSAYSNFEIAEMLGCSERKIERKLSLTREIWSRMK